MKIGAQLYTVRDFTKTAEDFEKTIKKVADIGYKCVQLSAIGPIAPAAVREICDRYGMDIVLTHTGPDRILNETDAVIAEHKIYGAKYIGIGSMPEKYRPAGEQAKLDGVNRFIADFKEPAEKIHGAGMMLMYHNHDFEFEKIGGKLMIDHLADGLSNDLIGFTLDTYWVQAGGGDPVFWLNRLAGRIDTIHYKDMAIVEHKMRMAEVMEGNLNWPAIFAASEAGGAKWAFVEQDYCYDTDPFKCLETSFRNLSGYFS